MRKLSTITAKIPPVRALSRYCDRRPLSSVAGHLTCLMLIRHQETATDLLVSDDGDAVGAIWIPKALVSVASPDRGRFLVVMIAAHLARRHDLSTPVIDRSRFTPDELAQLNDAIASAARSRKHLCGCREPLPFPGRNAFA